MSQIKNQSIPIIIKLNGWWGNKSAMLDPSCILFDLKKDMIKSMLEVGIITESNIDERNGKPHIAITTDTKQKSQEAYSAIDNKLIHLRLNSLIIQENFVNIDIAHSGVIRCHYTIFYKKNINNYKDIIIGIYENWFQKKSETISDKQCCICMENEYNCKFNCGHVCVCLDCSTLVENCPICRVKVSQVEKIFLS